MKGPHIHLLHEDGPWPDAAEAWSPGLAREYTLRRDGIPLLPTLVIPQEAMPLPGIEALTAHLADLHDFAPLLSPESRSDRVLLLLEVSWIPRSPNLSPFTLPVLGFHQKNHEMLNRGLDFRVYKDRLGAFMQGLEVLRRGNGTRWLSPLIPLEEPMSGEALAWWKKLEAVKTPGDWAEAMERPTPGKKYFEEVLTNNKGQLAAVLEALGRCMAGKGAPAGDILIRPFLDNQLLTDHISGGFMSADPWDGGIRPQGMVDRGGQIEEERGLEGLPGEVLAQVEKAAAAFRRHDAGIHWVEFLVVGSRLWVTGWRTVDGVSPRARWKRLAETVALGRLTASDARRQLTATQVASVLAPDFQKPMARWGQARPLASGRAVGPVMTDLRKIKPGGMAGEKPIYLCREWTGEVLGRLPDLGALILFGSALDERGIKILSAAGVPAVQVAGVLPEGRSHVLGPVTVKTGSLLSLGVERGGAVWAGQGDGELRGQPLVEADWKVLVGEPAIPGFRLSGHFTHGAEAVTAAEQLAEPWGMVHLPRIMAGEGHRLRNLAQSWLSRDDENLSIRLETDWKDHFTRTLAMGDKGEIHFLLWDGAGVEAPAGLDPLLLQPGWYRAQMRAFVEAMQAAERPTAGCHIWVPSSAFKHLGAVGLDELRGMAEGLAIGLLWQGSEGDGDFIPGILASDFTAFRAAQVHGDAVPWNLARALRPDHRRLVIGHRQSPEAMAAQIRAVRHAGAQGAFYPMDTLPLLRWALADRG